MSSGDRSGQTFVVLRDGRLFWGQFTGDEKQFPPPHYRLLEATEQFLEQLSMRSIGDPDCQPRYLGTHRSQVLAGGAVDGKGNVTWKSGVCHLGMKGKDFMAYLDRDFPGKFWTNHVRDLDKFKVERYGGLSEAEKSIRGLVTRHKATNGDVQGCWLSIFLDSKFQGKKRLGRPESLQSCLEGERLEPDTDDDAEYLLDDDDYPDPGLQILRAVEKLREKTEGADAVREFLDSDRTIWNLMAKAVVKPVLPYVGYGVAVATVAVQGAVEPWRGWIPGFR